MARPQIPDRLREEVEQIHKKHREYEASSFQEALGTVTDIAEGRRPTNTNPSSSNNPQDIEDPVERAVKLNITNTDDIPSPHGKIGKHQVGAGDIGFLLGLATPHATKQPSEAVYNAQEAVKTIREKENEGEIETHTADRFVEIYQKALHRHLATERDNRERLKGSYQEIADLEAAIAEFLRENYVEDKELEMKTGFDDFDTAADALVETVIGRLDIP